MMKSSEEEEERLREDGVSTLGFNGEEEQEEEVDEEDLYENKEEVINELPREKKEGKKCIDPCPKYECTLDPSSCETNCSRCLDNPCLLCEYNCKSIREDVLLREEYKKFKRFYGGKKVDAIYKEKAVDRRVELFNEKEELEEKFEILKEDAKDSALPTSLALFFKRGKLKELKKKKEEKEQRIEEGEELFP